MAARVLAGEGAAVRCFVLADLSEFKGDASAHLARMQGGGMRGEPFEAAALGTPDLVVAAIFGRLSPAPCLRPRLTRVVP